MKLYVCWGTFNVPARSHPCRDALDALRQAGYEPEVVRTYGFGGLPDAINPTRREVKRLSGQTWVPLLVTDDGTPIHESRKIVAWAAAHPAAATGRVGAAD